jgi:hypothetical protein
MGGRGRCGYRAERTADVPGDVVARIAKSPALGTTDRCRRLRVREVGEQFTQRTAQRRREVVEGLDRRRALTSLDPAHRTPPDESATELTLTQARSTPKRGDVRAKSASRSSRQLVREWRSTQR